MSSSKKKKRKKRRLDKTKPPKTKPPRPCLSPSLSAGPRPAGATRPLPLSRQTAHLPLSLSLSNSPSPRKNENRNRTRNLSAGPRQKVGVDAADGQRQARVQVGARQDGRHRAGDRRVGQGQGRRGVQGAAQDGAGGGRGGERQGREEQRSSFRVFFAFLFISLFFCSPNPCLNDAPNLPQNLPPSRQKNNINKQTKTVQPKSKDETGRLVQTESPIHSSNVMAYSKEKEVRSRIGHKTGADGKKVRVLLKTGEELP